MAKVIRIILFVWWVPYAKRLQLDVETIAHKMDEVPIKTCLIFHIELQTVTQWFSPSEFLGKPWILYIYD